MNRLQRDAAGKIKLGLDLQGGTEFLVEMDTNALANAQDESDTNHAAGAVDTGGAISQAVEVLRKRVDAFGVAEPVIQPAGGNRILIQLPGLSEADKESAKEQIQKAAYLEFRMVKDDSDEIIAEHEPIPPGYELLEHISRNSTARRLKNLSCKKRPWIIWLATSSKARFVSRGNSANRRLILRSLMPPEKIRPGHARKHRAQDGHHS